MKKSILGKSKILVSMMLLLCGLMVIAGCESTEKNADELTVAVSIGPQKEFVESIAGDLVRVVTMIPQGASPSNYQPSPKEMNELSQAKVYFSIGVNAEINILPSLSTMNDEIELVDLAKITDLVYEARFFGKEDVHEEDVHEEDVHEEDVHEEDENEGEHEDHDHSGRDPHIWMSPKRVIIIVEEIRDTLIQIDPDHKTEYTNNASEYIQELIRLDDDLNEMMQESLMTKFVVMHPSLGYFADDYNLEMVAIEEDGKEASASHLEEVIDYARENNIKVILYQAEFDENQAKTIADEIGATVESYEPLAEESLSMMYSLGQSFQLGF